MWFIENYDTKSKRKRTLCTCGARAIRLVPFKLIRAPCLFGWWLWPLAMFSFFFFSDSRRVSHSAFAWNLQNRFSTEDNEHIIPHFPSNKGGTSNIWFPCNFMELQPTPCMRVVCRVHGLGLSRTLKKNDLSLILLILLVELTNQKKGICRHRILYPLRLEHLFPNDVEILKPKVGLGPNQIEIDLRKMF